VGLDETLLLSPSLASVNGVRMWVLKPMLLGLVKTLEWIAIARRYQKRWMISSCFESIVGLSVLAQLSCLSLEAPGLGTALWLEDTQDFLANNGLIRKI
jgi:O-succinylbenzoate synthase